MVKHTRSILFAALLAGTAPAAHAEEWAELSWLAKWGEGTISYRRDVASTTLPDGSTTYADSIAYFNVVGWEFPAMRGHRFIGGGGDITIRPTVRDNCDPAFDSCNLTFLTFSFHNPYPDVFPSWQMNATYDGPLDASGHLPVSDEGGVGNLLAYFSNSRTDFTLTTLDGSRVPNNRLIAAPVPEPGALSLLAIGGVLALATPRRRRGPSGPAAASGQ